MFKIFANKLNVFEKYKSCKVIKTTDTRREPASTLVFCSSPWLLQMEIAIAADVTSWGSVVTYRERREQNNCSVVSEGTKRHKRWQKQPLAAPDTTPTGYTFLLWKKTNHLSEETTRHRHHMVEILIRGWRRAHPPVRWGISCCTWATNWRRNLSQVCFFFCLPTKSAASAGLLCNHVIKPKVLMTARSPFFFSLLLMRWLSALNASAPGFSG